MYAACIEAQIPRDQYFSTYNIQSEVLVAGTFPSIPFMESTQLYPKSEEGFSLHPSEGTQ